jgi:hypothetical protein
MTIFEVSGPYRDEVEPKISFYSSNKVVLLIKEHKKRFCGASDGEMLIDFEEKVIYTHDRPMRFSPDITIHYTKLVVTNNLGG